MATNGAALESGTGTPAAPHSYLQILKSTAIIGLSSVIVLALNVVRMKVVALLLGPTGVGLMGLYSAVLELGVAVSGMGLSQSGVRQVAEAGDQKTRLATTAAALHLTSLTLGVAGALVCIAFAAPISQITFGTPDHAWGVALLGAVVFLRVVAAGLTALVQGLRRIAALARINVYGALAGTVLGIPLVYWLGLEAIVPVLLISAGAMLGASWWYARDLVGAGVRSGLGSEVRALLGLGVVFMVSGFLTMGAAYAIRIIVLHEAGVFAAGLYQGAWAVGGIYAGFVLQAMGADFYPRLTTLARDDAAANRLVNEQAEISILLATPGLLATITLAPLALTVFYSAEFEGAVWLLRWICLGMMLRVIAWPMGFIVLAKAARRTFLFTELAATLIHVGGAALLVPIVGADGAGMAFFGLYIWHGVLIYVIVRRMSGFRWQRRCLVLGAAALAATAIALVGLAVLDVWPATLLGLALSLASGLYAVHAVLNTLPPASVPANLRRVLARLRLAGPPDAR